MFLIVGLGNPDKEYGGARHNISFEAIDYISNKYNIDINRTRLKGVYGGGFINNSKVILLKPTTYMNLSGESTQEVIDFYKLKDDEVIVIYGDIGLEVGRLRIREKGSAGGHNGIKSIITNMGTDIFPRVRIGVGQPTSDLVSHVLGRFNKEDMDSLIEVIDASSKAVEVIIKDETKEAMNRFNGFRTSRRE